MGDVARPLRTFQDDMASILQQGKTSMATVVRAEQVKRIEQHISQPPRKLLFVIKHGLPPDYSIQQGIMVVREKAGYFAGISEA